MKRQYPVRCSRSAGLVCCAPLVLESFPILKGIGLSCENLQQQPMPNDPTTKIIVVPKMAAKFCQNFIVSPQNYRKHPPFGKKSLFCGRERHKIPNRQMLDLQAFQRLSAPKSPRALTFFDPVDNFSCETPQKAVLLLRHLRSILTYAISVLVRLTPNAAATHQSKRGPSAPNKKRTNKYF